jgi:hypothetical protein
MGGKHSRLRPIHSIKSLIQEQAHPPAVIHPRRAILIQGGVVPQHGEEVGHDEHEARQRDQVGRHAHREALDDKVGVEGLEDVLGRQRAVDAGVLVLPQSREVILAEVHHRERCMYWSVQIDPSFAKRVRSVRFAKGFVSFDVRV